LSLAARRPAELARPYVGRVGELAELLNAGAIPRGMRIVGHVRCAAALSAATHPPAANAACAALH